MALSAQSTLNRPLENIGQITLTPRDLSGVREILINGDASDGSIRVEVVNEDGYRMRGFSKDDAVAITKNDLRGHVAWKKASQ